MGCGVGGASARTGHVRPQPRPNQGPTAAADCCHGSYGWRVSVRMCVHEQHLDRIAIAIAIHSAHTRARTESPLLQLLLPGLRLREGGKECLHSHQRRENEC